MKTAAEDRLIVALDVPDTRGAERLMDRLAGTARVYKIGKELFTAEGPAIVRTVQSRGYKVFLDLKYHDIPNTVAGACEAAAKLGVYLMNVHASGGSAMMSKAAEALRRCAPDASRKPLLLGVTVLTSMGDKDLAEIGVSGDARTQVERLAVLAQRAGLDGVVASPLEIAAVRKACGENFVIVTPGVRPTWAESGDQKRVMTPAEAIRAGADHIVVGRPITQATDPAEAARRVLEEVQSALQ
ncbi:MAG: Orotidine 5'-phosphate decarboxylase [Candidatus Omnitrophica bacterium]|nr:Orotidine 5'-phosphate decarboxylase [Candidatus Omnitrophota bacterium]